MARPKDKSLDPAWIQDRKHDRHKHRRRVILYVDDEVKASWLAQAAHEGYPSVPAWIRAIVDHRVEHHESQRN